jgi:hypothetical protein
VFSIFFHHVSHLFPYSFHLFHLFPSFEDHFSTFSSCPAAVALSRPGPPGAAGRGAAAEAAPAAGGRGEEIVGKSRHVGVSINVDTPIAGWLKMENQSLNG